MLASMRDQILHCGIPVLYWAEFDDLLLGNPEPTKTGRVIGGIVRASSRQKRAQFAVDGTIGSSKTRKTFSER